MGPDTGGVKLGTTAGWGRAGQGRAGGSRAGWGRVGWGRVGWGRAWWGRVGWGRAGWNWMGLGGAGRAGLGGTGRDGGTDLEDLLFHRLLPQLLVVRPNLETNQHMYGGIFRRWRDVTTQNTYIHTHTHTHTHTHRLFAVSFATSSAVLTGMRFVCAKPEGCVVLVHRPNARRVQCEHGSESRRTFC